MSTERVLTSVEDPNSFDTDPDPGSKKKFFTNPDPGQNYKNPDTGKIGLSTCKILYRVFRKSAENLRIFTTCRFKISLLINL